jgi:hypothetical protein
MTDALLERYQQLLTAFYDVDVEPPVAPANRARFLAERGRRVLDIARLAHAGWPRTTALAQAHSGDDVVHAVARGLTGLWSCAGSVNEAVEASLGSWVQASHSPLFEWVFAFEQLSRGRTGHAREASAEQRARLPAPAEATVWVLTPPFDLARAIRAIEFLTSRSATSALLREIRPLGPPSLVAGYRDSSGRMRVLAG